MTLRLDQALVAAGLAPSRARARHLIDAGVVRLEGKSAAKPSLQVAPDARIELTGDPLPYVSRGAIKLLHALDTFGLDPAGAVALDLGASTGGFTEVLLLRGAARVFAVDVGRGQLAPSLASDPRVTSYEGLHARDLDPALIPRLDWIVADLSFISLAKALPAALALAKPGAVLVALVKPQFEVGREFIGRGGIVRDRTAMEGALLAVRAFLERAGWPALGEAESPIRGGDGNTEFLIAARAPKAKPCSSDRVAAG